MKTNEHGIQIDKNGYAPSIVQTIDDVCERCGCYGDLARHEIYYGANRQKSKEEGLWVSLCPSCHTKLHERAKAYDLFLKQKGQKIAMKAYGWSVEDFRARFGKNWI